MRGGGYFRVCKLCFTEVIICHPILNLAKSTHKLQSLNSAQLLCLILLCGKGQPAVDQVPATQIIRLPFMSLFELRKNQQSGKLSVQYSTAAAAAAHRICCSYCLCFLSLDILNAVFKVCVVGSLLINHSGCPKGKQNRRLSPLKGPKCSCPLCTATMERLCKRSHQRRWQAWQTSLSGGRVHWALTAKGGGRWGEGLVSGG